MVVKYAIEHTALALVLICLVTIAYKHPVAGPKPSMSKKDAGIQCSKKKSNLVNYRQIKANSSSHKYLNQLNEGESAWIEGYAKLSPFLSWQGCYNISKIKAKTSFRTVAILYQSVNRCLRACHGYAFVGLKNTSCFCIDQSQRSTIQFASVNDYFCSLPCHNNAIDSCGGQYYMSVYAILEDSQIHWASQEPSSHLCVYVKRKQHYFNVYTTSCFTSQLINGYICTNSAWSKLSVDNCTSVTHQGTYCIIKEISTRQEALEGCSMRRGALADLGAESETPSYLNHNFKYWIGIHRTFGIAETYKEKETICLSATRSGDMLFLEPDDCSAQKFYLCASNSNKDTNEDTKTTPTPLSSLSRKTENERFLTTKPPPDLGTEGNNESPVPYIVPSALILIFIFLLILFIVYRRHKKRKHQTMRPLEDNYDSILYETDNVKNEYSLSSEPNLNADSKCLIVKSKPDKPERQTLKRRTTVSEYENFALKNNTKESSGKKKKKVNVVKDEEYDKLKFNSMPRSVKNSLEENNVYHHTVGPGNDNYDTMKSIKSFHSLGRVDETYSRMNDKIVLNDNNGCRGSTQLLHNTGDTNNASYNMQIERSDALQEEEQPRHFVISDDEDENLSTKVNDTQPEQLEISARIDYADISHIGGNSHGIINYTEIATQSAIIRYTDNEGTIPEFKRENAMHMNGNELELDSGDEKSKTVKTEQVKNTRDPLGSELSETMDATYARVQKATERENVNVKDPEMSLNYVKIDLPDTDDLF